MWKQVQLEFSENLQREFSKLMTAIKSKPINLLRQLSQAKPMIKERKPELASIGGAASLAKRRKYGATSFFGRIY